MHSINVFENLTHSDCNKFFIITDHDKVAEVIDLQKNFPVKYARTESVLCIFEWSQECYACHIWNSYTVTKLCQGQNKKAELLQKEKSQTETSMC